MAENGISDAEQFTMSLDLPDGPDESAANRTILHDAYLAIIAGNGGALFDLLDDDVEFIEASSLPYGTHVRGIPAAQAGVAEMFKSWRHMHVDITHFTASHDLVIAYMQMSATSRATGDVYNGPAAEIFRFRNGRIIEWRPIYWDTHLVRKVCAID